MSEQTPTNWLGDERVQRAITLIWHEAALLDAKDYLAWQELYTPEAIYVIPIDPDTEDFAASLNMVFDDDRMRRMRVERMMQGFSPSAVAAARTIRTVSNFRPTSVTDDEVTLKANQTVVAYKRNRFQTNAGEVTFTIALGGDGDRIATKVIRLLNSEDAVTASGYLL
ncbi:aromatic-ring-hydroxylating dioxygenase subunit beta [Granulicoccus sp. GXG6511]|uniref:aromatic-ring-hydroxylating dioxygenase subunit beta n=1 Tax=Granulicoccus sp. GXG6511 TaxID=3381351 RepID=UPI003D7D4998